MVPVLQPLSHLLHVNDQLFDRAIADVSEELALRPLDGGNRFLWVAAHMVIPRAGLVNRLGGQASVAWEAAFARGTEPPTVGPVWPKLAEVGATWREVAALLHARVDALTEAELARPIEAFPTTDGTVLGGITLLTFHDAYHIGQLGHLRRRLGLSRLVG